MTRILLNVSPFFAAENYNVVSRLNGHPGAGIGIQLAPGADALKTAELVKQEIERRSKDFPDGYKYSYPQDATAFTAICMRPMW